jgi:hypothetical protein
MAKNVGGVDRIVRVAAGLGLIAWAMLDPESPMMIAGPIGLVVLLTGIVGWCPAYLPFGMKTCKVK